MRAAALNDDARRVVKNSRRKQKPDTVEEMAVTSFAMPRKPITRALQAIIACLTVGLHESEQAGPEVVA
jgi:hypothetical protein